jgi:hypothetical protein
VPRKAPEQWLPLYARTRGACRRAQPFAKSGPGAVSREQWSSSAGSTSAQTYLCAAVVVPAQGVCSRAPETGWVPIPPDALPGAHSGTRARVGGI